MVLGNLMLLTEIAPRAAHAWFMEMFVDSADWVMGPNVYGMGIFSDGGIFATKPYVCGSNYLLKMSDYRKPKAAADGEPTWCDTVDGLYWRFVDEHRDYFGGNPRLGRMIGTLDRMASARREKIFRAANAFIRRVTR
jgi:deoxyribodipyrimidine photolyase-related protein